LADNPEERRAHRKAKRFCRHNNGKLKKLPIICPTFGVISPTPSLSDPIKGRREAKA
jgi:hypothetical protein